MPPEGEIKNQESGKIERAPSRLIPTQPREEFKRLFNKDPFVVMHEVGITPPTVATRVHAVQILGGFNGNLVAQLDTSLFPATSQFDTQDFEMVSAGVSTSGTLEHTSNQSDVTGGFSMAWLAKIGASLNDQRVFMGIRASGHPSTSGSMTTDHVGFVTDTSDDLFASNSEGSTQTKSAALAALSTGTFLAYRIDFDATTIKFYINNILVAESTTNLTADATMDISFSYTGAGASSSNFVIIKRYIGYVEVV